MAVMEFLMPKDSCKCRQILLTVAEEMVANMVKIIKELMNFILPDARVNFLDF